LRFTTTHITPGTTVHVEFDPAASVSGQVAWCGAQTAGVHFHRRLNTDVAVRLGLEEAPPPSTPAPEPAAETTGLQHWVRAIFGFVKR
jgi:hypothetical protein